METSSVGGQEGSIYQIMNPSVAPSEILSSGVFQLVGDFSESGSGELPSLTLPSSPDDVDPVDVGNVAVASASPKKEKQELWGPW